MGPLEWLGAYLAGWMVAVALIGRRRGRLEASPLAIIYRLNIQLEPSSEGRLPRAVSILGYASTAVAYGSMALFYYLVAQLFWARYVARLPGAQGQGLVPLIPGVTVPLSVLPHFLVALGVAAALHELAHALQARAEGLRVKNAGLALFVFIPAAFVELDEEELARAPLRSRLKVYSAGITANLLLFALFSGAAAALPCSSLTHGVKIIGVEEGSPAALAGLERGDLIVSVNGRPVHCIDDLARALEDAGVKDPSRAARITVTVERSGKELSLQVYKPVNHTTIGVTITNSYTALGVILYSSVMLNFALALVNAAPLFITDGGKMLTEPAEALLGPLGRRLAMGLQAATLIAVVSLLTIQPILPG